MWFYIRRVLIWILYLAPFARYSVSKISVYDFWPFKVTKGQIFYFFRKAHVAFYNNNNNAWHLSHTYSYAYHIGECIVTFYVTFYLFWKTDMGLYIRLLLIRTLYLSPFARYSTSKVLVNYLDPLGSPKVKYLTFFSKAHMWLYTSLLLIRTLSRTICEKFSIKASGYRPLTFHDDQR